MSMLSIPIIPLFSTTTGGSDDQQNDKGNNREKMIKQKCMFKIKVLIVYHYLYSPWKWLKLVGSSSLAF